MPNSQTFPKLFLAIIILASTGVAQEQQSFTGRWIWKAPAQKNKTQRQFTIVIHRSGNGMYGTYSVDEFINGKWQGEDGNQTPFVARLEGKILQLQFDPNATVPGYEKNVRYKAPPKGQSPSVANLTDKGDTLIWQFVSGTPIEGIPKQLTLHKNRK